MTFFRGFAPSGGSKQFEIADWGAIGAKAWGAGNFTASSRFSNLMGSADVIVTGIRFWPGFAGTKSIKCSIWNSAGVAQEQKVVSVTGNQMFSLNWSSRYTFPGNTFFSVSIYDQSGAIYPIVTSPINTAGSHAQAGQPWYKDATRTVDFVGMFFVAGDGHPVSGAYTLSAGEFYPVEPIFL